MHIPGLRRNLHDGGPRTALTGSGVSQEFEPTLALSTGSHSMFLCPLLPHLQCTCFPTSVN
ncbi:mCG115474 [Mus musculus]|nr:mCG115474 [Mus musculus]